MSDEKKHFRNADRPALPTNARMHSEMMGITKREYFAAMAMQGLLANSHYVSSLKNILGAKAMCVMGSLEIADELLKQLES